MLEDHPFERAVIVKVLSHLGCSNVLEASEGLEALTLLRAVGEVDLVICHLWFSSVEGGMDALEFLRLASQERLINSVVITNKLTSDLHHAMERVVGMLGLQLIGELGKPFSLKVLDRLLRMSSQGQYILQAKSTSPTRIPSRQLLLDAIARKEFTAFYQPKVDLLTGEVLGAEALVRWIRQSGETIPPAEFLSAVEQCGLLGEMFYDLLEQGLCLLRLVKEHGRELSLAFNVHCSQLADPELSSKIGTALRFHNIPASCVTFELTESGMIENSVSSIENLMRLRMMGCGLSIDDFGVGFSSLERLCQLPFNEIKLDASFIQGMSQKSSCRAVVEATLALAASLNMKVVAEGVETDEQRIGLAGMGFAIGQGYFFAHPMSGVDLLYWLDRSDKDNASA